MSLVQNGGRLHINYRMKFTRHSVVLFGFLSLIYLPVLNAQNTAADNAIQFLKAHKASSSPLLKIESHEGEERKAAELLYKAQMQALDLAKDYKDSSSIPILIPFLDYSRHPALDLVSTTKDERPEDLEGIKKEWPAFDAIVSMPNANKALAKYVVDTSNRLDYRLTAFQVLRYVDRREFEEVFPILQRELFKKHPKLVDYIKIVKDKNLPFSGMFTVPPDE